MRILVVGAGATGGYFGGRLAQAGRDVTFLVRPKRAEQLRARGLQIVSPHGDVTLTPQLVTPDDVSSAYDVVLLAVKAYALESAMDDLAPAVGSGTMILPFLNGMRHIDELAARFGDAAVLGGVCVVATNLDDAARIVQLAEIQQLTYGERDGTSSARIHALDALLQGAGFEARSSTRIMQAMWEKWVMLASLGAITCSMRGTIGEVEAVPGGADLALGMLAECTAVASASGYSPSDEFLTRTTGALTAHGSGLASSMYRDLQQGRSVEVDQILGDLLDRARAHGVPAPLLTAAFVQLSIYQRRLTKGS